MELILKIAFFAVATASLGVGLLILAWRTSQHTPDRSSRWAIRTGAVTAFVAMGTIGVAEAGLLGFDPEAVIAAAILGALGFGLGAAVGAVAGSFAKRQRVEDS